MDILVRIKRAVMAGRHRFSGKALREMAADGLSKRDVIESIFTARAIYKVIRSTSPFREHATERLFIIRSRNLSGLLIYTKGKLMTEGGKETFYFLVWSKRALWS
ncbi:MAG: hypothetical protein FJ291_33715 [Planctomycetes bacterium]|nr:hypothetical protein [Planctomycetota bacterium]